MNDKPALKISNLSVTFRNTHEVVNALSGFSCSLYPGECIAIIGESGCGKSVAAHAILKLFPDTTDITGSIRLDTVELLTLPELMLREIRGKKIGIIYQNPDRSLNPIYRIGRQMKEPLNAHQVILPADGRKHLINILRRVGFPDPDVAVERYPCHCSGGMNQRAASAVVLGLMPEIVIADEPTKGLDNNRVADIESCLWKMKQQRQSLLLITHDITLAERIADGLIVMYAGQIVEKGPVDAVLSTPLHPYTEGLMRSLPRNGFIPIEGYAPPLTNLPSGCRFAERCTYASDHCIHQSPEMKLYNGRGVRCHHR